MGFEPTTPCLQSRCSSQLSYVPEVVGQRTGQVGAGANERLGGGRRGAGVTRTATVGAARCPGAVVAGAATRLRSR